MPKLIRITTVPISLQKLISNQMNFMKANGFEVIMMSADGNEVQELVEEQGCPHIVVPMTRQITPFKDLYCLMVLVYQFIKIKPDIVHTHTPKAGLLGMLAAYITRVPIRMHTVAGLPLMTTYGFKKKLLVLIEKLTYSTATMVLPNSHSLKKYIIENQFCEQNKLSIIGKGSSNGIEISEFERENLDINVLDNIKKQISYNPNNTYLLAVGRMVNDKGITELVDAFEEITPQYNGRLKLILVGPRENDLDPLPNSTIHKIESNENIIEIGFSNKVSYFMSISNILIHPSHREGFPNVLLQAGIMKCPIICSNIMGNIDIIENEKEGVIFEVKNTYSLVQAIKFSLTNYIEVIEKAENLYQKIKLNFDRNIIQNEYLKTYNRLIKELKINRQ